MTLVQIMACCLVAPSQAIIWNIVDLSSERSCVIHLRAISQRNAKFPDANMCMSPDLLSWTASWTKILAYSNCLTCICCCYISVQKIAVSLCCSHSYKPLNNTHHPLPCSVSHWQDWSSARVVKSSLLLGNTSSCMYVWLRPCISLAPGQTSRVERTAVTQVEWPGGI